MWSPRDFDRRAPGKFRLAIRKPCRCADLADLFGVKTLCGPCALARAYEAKLLDGWHPIPTQHCLAYRDCAVEVTATADGQWWAPCWAWRLVTELLNTAACGPILARAAFDSDFRDACLTITTAENADDIGGKLRDFATAQGVVVSPTPR